MTWAIPLSRPALEQASGRWWSPADCSVREVRPPNPRRDIGLGQFKQQIHLIFSQSPARAKGLLRLQLVHACRATAGGGVDRCRVEPAHQGS